MGFGRVGQPKEDMMRLPTILVAGAAALAVSACTYVERDRPAPAPQAATVVVPAQQQPTIVTPVQPAPTVTVRPGY
jgi:hypothetical protein